MRSVDAKTRRSEGAFWHRHLAHREGQGREAPGRLRAVPRVVLKVVLTGLVVAALGWGPLLVVAGAVRLHRADHIRQAGVQTTATVLDENPAGNPDWTCTALDVTYRSLTGRAERAMVYADNCLPAGSTLEVIYDPEMPHMARLASLGTTDAWVDIVSGLALAALVWSLAVYGVLDVRRRRT